MKEPNKLFEQLRTRLIGEPLPTEAALHERLAPAQALAVLSSDALSSVAYATEEIMYVLVTVGAAALVVSPWLALAIVILLGLVVSSYRQTIHAYPTGGGAYLVTRDNFGANASLIAGSALLIDYVLTVAVSISAGIAAITSAFPVLQPYRVWLALVALVIVTVANLRGVRESGRLFAVPTYLFIITIFTLVAVGFVRLATGSLEASSRTVAQSLDEFGSLPLLLVLRAFASGCTALTGVEAISDGVMIFRKPEAANASKTLLRMGILLAVMFLGLTLLADRLDLGPSPDQTVISQMARSVFGAGVPYYLVQAATTLILLLAANTSFSDFPRLANFIARDRFLPSQFADVGDRLVYANGIQALAVTAGALIVIFGAETHALIPLYAIGVFISFTFSQAGMVFHWRRLRPAGWQRTAALNAIGALATALVLTSVSIAKFVEGAWITFVLIGLLVLLAHRIRAHYDNVAAQLSLDKAWPVPIRTHTIVVPVDALHRGVVKAIHYAETLRGDLKVVTVAADQAKTDELVTEWAGVFPTLPLIVIPSPYRSVIDPLIEYTEGYVQRPGDYVTVVLPEFVPAHWWEHWLHNQTARIIRKRLYNAPQDWAERYHVITGVRFFLNR